MKVEAHETLHSQIIAKFRRGFSLVEEFEAQQPNYNMQNEAVWKLSVKQRTRNIPQ